MRAPIFQLDAFTTRRFAGNPAAVVVLDRFLDDALLQAVAAENNLAETAFVVPSEGRYRLRWFTPTVEVPLCGHATLAAGAVVIERLEPGRDSVVFDTASGPLTVGREDTGYRMDLPARTVRAVPPSPALSAALGVTPVETVTDGYNYLALLAGAGDVRSLQPDLAAIACLDRTGVVVTAAGDGTYDFVSRYFAPAKGIPEDPVTGGAHCALVPFWAARIGKDAFFAYQASRRGGELTCRLHGDRVRLHGSCVFYLDGSIEV
ncbi:PhzF family phenazine biosynthesis protein [Actinoplanes sp. NEAU-A12]|uniref:PhzF family phenazine biosynthesis protein n=1 Tax=Actinoplanes sandaracinus TaxID=3045177 RepID=A0ABT6WV94_9ACTN|nr:PhzF family phenazine biosynthesis protein [Actinoplanes sandaracinus]MDI6103668.1 PhzF family phenazine biosynthesis protein [Actinoplanes sandaracinus]